MDSMAHYCHCSSLWQIGIDCAVLPAGIRPDTPTARTRTFLLIQPLLSRDTTLRLATHMHLVIRIHNVARAAASQLSVFAAAGIYMRGYIDLRRRFGRIPSLLRRGTAAPQRVAHQDHTQE